MLSNRYITDRFLPDKAIDLVDEAASKLRMEMTSLPVELDETERRIMQLEIEREALRKEKDAASRERLENLEKELADLKEKRDALRSRWEGERETLQHVADLREQIDQTKVEIEQASRAYDLNRAAELQYGTLVQLEQQLREAEQQEAAAQDGRLLKEEVDGEDIAEIVSRWTGVPVSRLVEGEIEKLMKMEDRLHERVIGQDEAIDGRGQRHPPLARRALRSRTARWAASSSSVRPASARPSWRGPWRSSCSTTIRRWCASTCPSTWSRTRSAASSALLPATSDTRRADS